MKHRCAEMHDFRPCYGKFNFDPARAFDGEPGSHASIMSGVSNRLSSPHFQDGHAKSLCHPQRRPHLFSFSRTPARFRGFSPP